jgi:hypothetical protein
MLATQENKMNVNEIKELACPEMLFLPFFMYANTTKQANAITGILNLITND